MDPTGPGSATGGPQPAERPAGGGREPGAKPDWDAGDYFGTPLSDAPSRAATEVPDPALLWSDLFDPIHSMMVRLHTTHNFVEALQVISDLVVDRVGFGLAGVKIARSDGMLETLTVSGADRQIREALSVPAPAWQVLRDDIPFEQVGQWQFVSHEQFKPPWYGPYHASRVSKRERADAWHPNDHLRALLTDATGGLIGLMQVDEPPGGVRPGPELMKVLDLFAVESAVVVRGYVDSQRLGREVTFAGLAHKITALGLRDDPPERLLREAADVLCRGMDADRVTVRIVESERLPESVFVAPAARYPPPSQALLRLMHRLSERAWNDQRAAVVSTETVERDVDDPREEQVLRQAFEERGIESLLVAPLGAAGQPIGYVVMGRGTGKLAWDDAEREAASDIARDLASVVLNATLSLAERRYSESARELDRRRRELLATVSHEFKGPISAVAGHAELLADALEPDQPPRGESLAHARDSVAAIARNAERLTGMVDELLAVEAQRVQDQPAQTEAVDLVQVVAEVMDIWRAQARERGIVLRLLDAGGPMLVRGSIADVGHVVRNLISNAVKFSPDGGEVMLTLENGETTIDFHCRDQGIGIPAEEQARVFDQFYRGSDDVVRRTPGSGLGLSIVQRIMTDLGGAVAVESQPGKTVFTAFFPPAGRGRLARV